MQGYNSILLNDEHTLLADSQEMPKLEGNLDHELDHEDNHWMENRLLSVTKFRYI